MGQGHRGADAIAGRRWDATAAARRSDPFEKHARETQLANPPRVMGTGHAPVQHDVRFGPVDGVVHPAAGLLHAETAPLSLVGCGGMRSSGIGRVGIVTAHAGGGKAWAGRL